MKKVFSELKEGLGETKESAKKGLMTAEDREEIQKDFEKEYVMMYEEMMVEWDKYMGDYAKGTDFNKNEVIKAGMKFLRKEGYLSVGY